MLHAGAGAGTLRRAAANDGAAAPGCGAARTGRVRVSSARPGRHTSWHSSQSTRAVRRAWGPASVAGTRTATGSSTSPE